MVLSRNCGEFVTAAESNGRIEPVCSECPEYGGTSFEHNGSGRIVETG